MLKKSFTKLKIPKFSGSILMLSMILGSTERAQAQVLLSEDFSTATNFTPPANWLNEDLGGSDGQQIWTFNNPGGRNITGGTPGFSGQFAIIDSDDGGSSNYQNTSLTSPAFNASNTSQTYILEFDDNWEECCEALGQVQIWNGTTWTTVLTQPNPEDGDGDENPSVHKIINITAATGNFNAAKVRFHYEGDFDYWWAIDNVTITAISCTSPTATFALVPDCANSQFSINVNVSNMGSATSLLLSDGTNTYGSTINTTGSYIAGPFAQQVAQTITLINNQNTTCNLVSDVQIYNCTVPSDECSGAITLTSSGTCTPSSGNTAGVTASAYGASDCEYSDYGDQWFSFQATHTEHFIQLSNTAMSNPLAYDVYYGIAAYSGNCGNFTEMDCEDGEYYLGSSDPIMLNLTNLAIGQVYYIKVWEDEAYDEDYFNIDNDFTFDICLTEPLPPPSNDSASGAIALAVGAPCSGNPYNNQFATLGTGEPYSNCNSSSEGEHSMWFKFVAPASGSVKITTDIGPLGTLDDTKIGLFQVGDSSLYSTFQIIACDDDNGIIDDGYASTIFTTALVPNQTYYVEVDGFGTTSTGTFCIQVEEINPTMLSNSASCADLQTPVGNEPTYTGWVTLMDENGMLVANVRNTAGGEANDYSGSYNIDGNGFNTPRQDAAGRYYLSRNYMISNSSITTPVDVRFYFHPGEIATLASVTSNETNLTNLNVTKQESNVCNANFADANGATALLMQNANGQINGVSWIQVSTSSFSNFYLMGGITPLAIRLSDISAANLGRSNQVKWITAKEEKGDYFELERSSDAKNFSFLTKIQSNNKASNYVFNDNNPLEKENFYRLKLVSKDGKFIYSKVVSAIVPENNGFAVEAYPNPAKNNVKVKVVGSQNGDITLTDIAGRVIYQAKVNGNEVNIDLTKVATGVYFLKYVDNNLTKTIKLNKQ